MLDRKSRTICWPAGVSEPFDWFQLPYQMTYAVGVPMIGPPWKVMTGVWTAVLPVVGAGERAGRELVSCAFGLSGRLSGLTLWTTGPRPSCAWAVLIS